MDFWGGGVGEGTPTKMAKGWILMLVLTVPAVSMTLIFLLCCCRVHYFDYFRPIATWRAKRKAQRKEDVEKHGFVVGDVRRQHSVVGRDREEGETLSQRTRRLRAMGSGSEMNLDGHYSPTVHLSPGYRSPRTPSVRGSVVEHYQSMVPEIPTSTMASANGMVAGSSYCPSVASSSIDPLGLEGDYRPVSQLGSIYSPDTRGMSFPASQSGSIHGIMAGSPLHSAASPGNIHTFARHPSYNNFRNTRPPSVSSSQRFSCPSPDDLRAISHSSSINGMDASQPILSPGVRQIPSRGKSSLLTQEYPSPTQENLRTVSERSAHTSEPTDGTVAEPYDTYDLPLSATQLALLTDGVTDSSTHPFDAPHEEPREF